MPDWISLDKAIDFAWRSGATDENLNEILAGGFKACHIGITAVLEYAPVDRVRVNWPARAAELDAMRTWRTPRHVEEFLTRAVGVMVEPGNRLQAMILWGNGVPPLEADTCILAAVHVHRPALVSELEAAGFAVSNGSAVSSSGPNARRRGAYKGVLEAWLAQKPLAQLRRMSVEAITKDFKLYCERERPELLRLFPRRLRSMEPTIQRIIDRRVKAAQAGGTQNKGQ